MLDLWVKAVTIHLAGKSREGGVELAGSEQKEPEQHMGAGKQMEVRLQKTLPGKCRKQHRNHTRESACAFLGLSDLLLPLGEAERQTVLWHFFPEVKNKHLLAFSPELIGSLHGYTSLWPSQRCLGEL